MADLTGLELARPGEWNLTTGPLNMTVEMLNDAVAFAARPESRPVPVRLGHHDPRFDGEPALGWLTNLRLAEAADGGGEALVGDVVGMPDWLSDVMATSYPDRSIEGWTEQEVDGRKYGFLIDGLALLGVTPPGMSTIRSLRDLPQALGVAAAGLRITATIHTPNTPVASASGSTSNTTGEEPADVSVFTDEQLNTLRQQLGLSEDADAATILAAQSEALAERAEPETAPPAAAPVIPEGMTVIETDVLEGLKTAASAGQAARVQQLTEERDRTIDAAVKAGKITPARVQHWATAYDADPEGAAQTLASLPAGLVPVEFAGTPGDPDQTSEDALLASLGFGNAVKAGV